MHAPNFWPPKRHTSGGLTAGGAAACVLFFFFLETKWIPVSFAHAMINNSSHCNLIAVSEDSALVRDH